MQPNQVLDAKYQVSTNPVSDWLRTLQKGF